MQRPRSYLVFSTLLRPNWSSRLKWALASLTLLGSASAVALDTWENAGFLTFFRTAHTATVLDDGRVLIVGGFGQIAAAGATPEAPLASAEIFDPATGNVSPAGTLNTARQDHTATLLNDGRVLVTGGLDDSFFPTQSAEIWDPLTNAWTPAGDHAARYRHTATRLLDGRVLIAGGKGSFNTLSTSEYYDPSSNSFIATSGSLNAVRESHTATLLGDGRVLVTGGQFSPFETPNVEVYDPVSTNWEELDGTPVTLSNHTATRLLDGRVLLVGGTSATLFDPTTDTTAEAADPAFSRQRHGAVLLADGRVQVMGGLGSGAQSTEIFDPSLGAWTTADELQIPVSDHTASMLQDGRVLITGGQGAISPSARVDAYDPSGARWSAAGRLNTPRSSHTTTLLSDGRVLVAGGESSSGQRTASVEIFQPSFQSWFPSEDLKGPRSGHTATLLPDGRVLLVGGYDQLDEILDSAEILDLSSDSAPILDAPGDGPTPSASIPAASLAMKRTAHTATLLNNGQVLVAGGENNETDATATAELYEPEGNTWRSVGDFANARYDHSATLLADGRVLAVGGQNDNGATFATSELYDPANGSWSLMGNLVKARNSHSATLLVDGRVLVIGGQDSDGNATSTTELYDPETGVWSAGGDLAVARSRHSATLLPDGRVQVAGGNDYRVAQTATPAVATVEVYDPATNSFSVDGGLRTPRSYHTATLLVDGRPMLVGGLTSTLAASASSEIHENASGGFVATGSLSTGRSGHTTTVLPDGGVLVAGGVRVVGGSKVEVLASAARYDSTSGTFAATGNLTTAREQHTATLLANGEVLLVGGATTGEVKLRTVERYNPATGTFSVENSLATARASHSATLLADGQVLISGGRGDNDTLLGSAELYDPLDRTWRTPGAALKFPRADHTATLLEFGTVLVAGGTTATGPSGTVERFDPATETWLETNEMPGARTSHAASLLPSGQVLITGGLSEGSLAVLYNPVFSGWSITARPDKPRWQHTSTLLDDGRVLVSGGRSDNFESLDDAEIYDPATGRWRARTALTVARHRHTATRLASGDVLMVGGETSQNSTSSAELYDRGLNFSPSARPEVTNATESSPGEGVITLIGSNFRGLTEAGSGTTQSSASDHPVVQVRRIDNESVVWLSVDPDSGWSDVGYTSTPIDDFGFGFQVDTFPGGPALVTVFTNGIPSQSAYLVLDPDRDGDGVSDSLDPFPSDPDESVDSDGDGIGDNGDPDDDGDTMTDVYENANLLDPLNNGDALTDFDGDGFSNLVEFQVGTAAADENSVPTVDPDVMLFASVLPGSRSVSVGDTATAFATIINAGSAVGRSCAVTGASGGTPLQPFPLPLNFSFSTTDPATNQVDSPLGYPASQIDPGSFQTYLFSVEPLSPLAPTAVWLGFKCANSTLAPIVFGLNTLLLSATNGPVPDIVALSGTTSNDGVTSLPGDDGAAAFSVASVNVGAAASISAVADTGNAELPVVLAMCQTDPSSGACVNPTVPTTGPVTTTIDTGATPTFSVFVTGTGNVPFDPAANRVFVRFKDTGGATRGATSVAVRTE